MLISKEVKKLKKRIKPLIDDHVEWLSIGIEFAHGSWLVTPTYEGAGDGHPSYVDDPITGLVLTGEGYTLVAAIKNLNAALDELEYEMEHDR